MNYIGNIPELNIVHTDSDRYDYVFASNPTIDINPSVPYATWLNILTGELFICRDATPDLNLWLGMRGTKIYDFPIISNVPDRVIPFTVSNLRGACTDGTYIYVGAYDTSPPVPLHRLNMDLTVVDSLSIDFTNYITDLEIINGDLFASAGGYIHRLNGYSTQILDTFDLGDTMVGVTTDGTDLLTMTTSNVLSVHNGVSSSVKESIQLDLYDFSSGICFADGNLVVRETTTSLRVLHGYGNSLAYDLDISSSHIQSTAMFFHDDELWSFNTNTDLQAVIFRNDAG